MEYDGKLRPHLDKIKDVRLYEGYSRSAARPLITQNKLSTMHTVLKFVSNA